MNKQQIETIADSMEGLFAYDTGCVDSGVRDEDLRERVKQEIRALTPDERRSVLTKIVVYLWCSDDAIKNGYSVEDIAEFISWLEDFMNLIPLT